MKFLIACAVIYAIWWMGGRRKSSTLSLREARELLGVSAGAGEEEIRAAHRRLIGRVHPDTGGLPRWRGGSTQRGICLSRN